MKIEKVLKYKVDGKEFSELSKAINHVEEKILKFLTEHQKTDMNLKYSSVTKLAEAIIKNRLFLADLLSYELPGEGEEDDIPF